MIEVRKPSGGVVEVEGRRLPFSRAVVHDKEGRATGHTTVLEQIVQLGQEVEVEVVEDHVVAVLTGIQPSCPAPHPDLPQGSHHHKVRVVELLGEEGGRQLQGLATIQSSQLVRSGGAAASMVGECATFSASDLYFFGVRLTNTDLGLVISPGDEVYCQLDMLEVKEGRAQYRVKVGWIQRGPTGASAHGGPGWKWPGQLQPESAALHRHLLKLGLSFHQVEEILVGKAPLQCNTAPPNYAVGTICELEPAENNETVSRGLIKLTAGPRKGSVIKFTRAKAFLFGVCLEKSDLLYLVRPQELVCCEVSGLADYKEGEYVTQEIHLSTMQPVAKKDPEAVQIPSEWGETEKRQLAHWLAVHGLTWKELKEVFAGTSHFRYFIPFPRDPLVGRVVCFDPVRGHKYGCTSGTIVVESGVLNIDQPDEGEPSVKDMTGEKITFHRSCFWVYGRKMAKADLSYLVQPNQRVVVECRAITPEDRAIHPSLPQDIHYRATIIWIGPSRPRNDRDDPNRCRNLYLTQDNTNMPDSYFVPGTTQASSTGLPSAGSTSPSSTSWSRADSNLTMPENLTTTCSTYRPSLERVLLLGSPQQQIDPRECQS